jgi:anti-sigma regulatory factor (Ser/Thr protein kinase)
MIGGVADLLTIDPELLDDLKTAVSEACNNVVLHAYGGQPGPMSVCLYINEERIRIVVADSGAGLTAAQPAEGIGLSVIRALAADVVLESPADGGTRVQMDFPAQRDGHLLLVMPTVASSEVDWPRAREDEVMVSLSPVSLLTGVLGRLARTLAATAHFSLDRFSDVYLVTDTLAAHATRAAVGGRVQAHLLTQERRLELSVGPFRTGTGEALRSPPGDRAPSPLVLLSDEVSVQPDTEGEVLRVVVIDHRR